MNTYLHNDTLLYHGGKCLHDKDTSVYFPNILLLHQYKPYNDIVIDERGSIDTGASSKCFYPSNDLIKSFNPFVEDLRVCENSYIKTVKIWHDTLRFDDQSKCNIDSFSKSSVPLVKGSVRDIYNKIDKPFLESIKHDYLDFNSWFDKVLDQNRKCYFLEQDSDLSALLIYNIESSKEHQLPRITEKALKLCTFKVSNQIKGYKVGESFINESIRIATNNRIGYIYLTVFPKHQSLISLLTKFDFVNSHQKDNGELVFIKQLVKAPSMIPDFKNGKYLISIKVR